MQGCVKYADRLAQPEAHPAAGQFRVPDRDARQAGPGLSRLPGRPALPEDRREPGRLELCRPPDPPAAPLCRAEGDQRAGRRDQQRAAADHLLRRRRDLVAGLERDAAVRREGRHPVLHDPAGPRRRAGRPPVFVPDDALDRVPRRRSDHRSRHADELRHRPRRAAALRRQRQDRAHRDRRRGTGPLGAQRRYPGRRRLQVGAAAADRRARPPRPPTNSPAGGRSWPTARRRSAPAPAATTRPTATSTRCGCARRSRISRSATRSCASTARRSSITAASRCRPSSRAIASIRGRSARWASACRSRSAPRPASPTSR